MDGPASKRRILRLIEQVFENPRLSQPLKRLASPAARSWFQKQKWRAKVALGVRLVPEEALTRKYVEALEWLARVEGRDALGDYLEFGVFNGTSMYCMHRAVEQTGSKTMRLFGFDSFEGLPASAAVDDWDPGSYQIDEAFARRWLTRRGIDWERVFLIKGWFSDTLTPALLRQHSISRASVVMVDCDAYESAKEALRFCLPLLGERAVIFFDDWNSGGRAERNQGEKRAWDETVADLPGLDIDDMGGYNANSRVLRITRAAPERRLERTAVWAPLGVSIFGWIAERHVELGLLASAI
jgi:predicted O-methyltransferase YrrM